MSDSAPPGSRLPARPSLEQLRKQAKELLRAAHAADDAALARHRAIDARRVDPGRAIALADAQHVVAREYGFESWPALVHHVGTTSPDGLSALERFAEEVARAYVAGDAMAIREINWTYGTSFVWDHSAERMHRRLPTWYASAERSLDVALADARHLVARKSGFDSWPDLVMNLAKTTAANAGTGGRRAPARAPFFSVDERERSISVHGPMSERDWDTVFSVMRERRLTGLSAAGLITDAALERLSRLDHVTNVDLSVMTRATAAGLRHLARLPLQRLDLGGWGTQVDDAGLAVLASLPELRALSLMWARQISDAGIAHLAACDRLETVNLMGTPTGDGIFRALAGKSTVRVVDAGTRVTPAGLALAHGLPQFTTPLTERQLREARASNKVPTMLALHPPAFIHGGLDALVGLDGLYQLRLFTIDPSIPPVTAAALAPVTRLAGLESLWCGPSTDALPVISAMPRLRILLCQDTNATDDGWAALGRSTSIERVSGRRTEGSAAEGWWPCRRCRGCACSVSTSATSTSRVSRRCRASPCCASSRCPGSATTGSRRWGSVRHSRH